MKIPVKVRLDRDFVPSLRYRRRWVVLLPTDETFCVWETLGGAWVHMFATHMDWPSKDAAIVAGLTAMLSICRGSSGRWKRTRIKPVILDIKGVRRIKLHPLRGCICRS